jgi:hypothetical protein
VQSGGVHDARLGGAVDACHVTDETLRIVINVRVDGDEISGYAGEEPGQPRPFLGWLGLIATLDRLLDVSKPPPERSE